MVGCVIFWKFTDVSEGLAASIFRPMCKVRSDYHKEVPYKSVKVFFLVCA
jgi:hypothetical protein